jgi:phosphate transport system permease protein
MVLKQQVLLWRIKVSPTAAAQLSDKGTTHRWEFLISEPEDAGRQGGIASILVSTTLLLCVCLGVAVPLGLGTVILLAEFTALNNWFGRLV